MVVAVALLLAACDQQAPPTRQIYPWQITSLPDGNSRVFGLEFNHSTLEDAQQILGNRHDEALFANADGGLSLEIYFNEVTLGGLSGRFVLTLSATQDELAAIRQRAVNRKRTESGALRYRPAPEDRHRLFAMPISALSYIPYVDLDEELVRQRFGTPDEIITLAGGKRHLLYPDKGLDLLLDEDGKELLQYVAPRDFGRLREPLLTPSDG